MEIDHSVHEVKSFIAKELAARYEKLTLETRLLHDLGCSGDDGWDFMTAFGKKFGVDMSGFDSYRHFGDETPWNPLGLILLFYRPRSWRFIPITVGDLVNAVTTKKWQTPNREPI